MVSTSADRTIALMYHAIGQPVAIDADPHYAVEITRFSEQLATCVKHGGAAISARDFLAGRSGVILTFDDGHGSNYDLAFPALVAAGASADFFVNPMQVGTRQFASWSQLREMADGGMSIQSHGFDHRYYLTDLSPARLREDLRRSRLEIEEKVGHPVTLLAPPGGRTPFGLTAVARECGFTHVLNSRPGQIRRGPARMLPRMAVNAGLNLPTLESWLRGGRALLRAQVRYAVLDLAKRVLGNQTYESVRERFVDAA